jgi:hypothetical protein
VVYPQHNGELPNDWRFETIRDLCVDLSDSSQPDWEPDDYRDDLSEIVNGMVFNFDSSLFSWLADYPSRSEFDDDCYAEGHTSLASLARARQYEEIESMAFGLINALSIRQALISKEIHNA